MMEVIKVAAIPPQKRNRKSAIDGTKEWRDFETKVRNGLRPHEGLKIVMTVDTMRKLKHAPRMFQKRAQNLIEELGLNLVVFQRGQDNGTPVIYVADPGQLS